MEVRGYTREGTIEVTIDGLGMTVPDDMSNRHRRMIAEWEAAGNTIPAYVPPAPVLPPLTPRQLWIAALQAGVTKASVLEAIEAVEDPEEREYMRIEINEANAYSRHHPAVEKLAQMMAMPNSQIDALWVWAATL